ncbi:hypothetical protein R3P38DRAFT_2778525 [Favolaschia claudopus]|uniref:Uncharacterized protein n=1 Tax=Favolaschia claudopus TaxID=2862362 RepID=A0AAW0BHC9_9AGAR
MQGCLHESFYDCKGSHVFIGSSIQGEFTRLKKQFTQLENQKINTIDLKQFAIQRALIEKKESGSLDSLAAKFLGVFLSKDPSLRTGENWEQTVISPDLINFAALDVYTSRLIFEKLSETAALECVQHDTPPRTRVALMAREGGEIVAYGQISPIQTSSYAGVRITKSRVLVDVDFVVVPSAAAVLHLVVPSTAGVGAKTRSGALTLAHLRSLSDSPDSSFHLVSPVSLLQFDRREPSQRIHPAPTLSPPLPLDPAVFHTEISDPDSNEAEDDEGSDDKILDNEDQADERLHTEMLEANAEAGLGVVLYEKVGVDKHGLELFSCRRGTNKLEGGPHSDISTGSLGPFMVCGFSCHPRPTYKFKAMAKHEFGVNWEYHHDLALINRTSFLLNYLADVVPGVESYADWLNADLYERTTEKFGICEVPGVALPIVHPTSPEARTYYFANVGDFVIEASASGQRKISNENFARRWNSTADGKTRFFITADILAAFAKSWEKTNNARASQELISAKVDMARQTRQLFQDNNNLPFPTSLLGTATSSHPQEGVLEFDAENPSLPSSISTELAISRPHIPPPQQSQASSSTSVSNAGQARSHPSNTIQSSASTLSDVGVGQSPADHNDGSDDSQRQLGDMQTSEPFLTAPAPSESSASSRQVPQSEPFSMLKQMTVMELSNGARDELYPKINASGACVHVVDAAKQLVRATVTF